VLGHQTLSPIRRTAAGTSRVRTTKVSNRRRVGLEMSETAMAAGAEHFGGLARDLVGAMEGYSDEELAVVRRWLEDMTAVVSRHSRAEPPPS
jgi:hypothetical protein